MFGMRGWILNDAGQIQYREDLDCPDIAEGEVLVNVKASGICGSDIARIYKTGAHVMPIIPGHEFSGVVTKCASKEDEKWLGKRVGIFPLIPCNECHMCQEKKYEMCTNYNYLGSRCDGGYAEFVKVPVWNLIELPDNVSFEAAAMLEPMAVAMHAIRRVDIKEGDNVIVCGLGTIGLLIAMFLKARGVHNVFAIGSKDFQFNIAGEIGISKEDCADARNTDLKEWVNKKTDGTGADVFFECVGKNETVKEAVDFVGAGARVCFVGNPYSDMTLEKDIYWKILRRQIVITGTWNSSFLGPDGDTDTDDWKYVVDSLKTGKVFPEKLITKRLGIDQMKNGFEIMRDKSEEYIKIMGIF